MDKKSFLSAVLNRAECKKHHAFIGLPCFLIPKTNGFGYYAAICNKRAIMAGFVGEPSANSLRIKKR